MREADSVKIDSCDKEDELRGDVEDAPIDLIWNLLMREVREYAREIKDGRRCMMCPFRSINAPYRLRDHVRLYRMEADAWCSSGGEKLRRCVALYDFDKLPKNKIPPVGEK